MKDENEQCQHCNRSSPLAGLQTCLALQIKWHFNALWCQHARAGEGGGAGPPSPPCSRQSAIHVERIIMWTQNMCRYLEREFWPCHLPLQGHNKLNKHQWGDDNDLETTGGCWGGGGAYSTLYKQQRRQQHVIEMSRHGRSKDGAEKRHQIWNPTAEGEQGFVTESKSCRVLV